MRNSLTINEKKKIGIDKPKTIRRPKSVNERG